ncbi:MAG: asparaginase [Anaerolineaceae bacterium]|nr:asparaginase [Anaerolineaceae bacterium]
MLNFLKIQDGVVNASMYEPLVSLSRGPIEESLHFGAAAVVDSNGKLMFSLGDANGVTYLRSTSKPLQAIPFVEAGGAKKFEFTEEETAIMCASHHGTAEHVRVVQSMHQKAGLRLEQMMCGVHYPEDTNSRNALIEQGQGPVAYHHNCSGKHTMMLAYAKLMGYSSEDYIQPHHPVQRDILRCVSEMCQYSEEKIAIGVDGCTVPVFGMPLYNAALGFARMADPHALSEKRAAACRTLSQAMMHYPMMIAGPKGFDTHLMTAANGKVFCKAGAEGFQGVGILPGVLGPDSPGIGIAIKISDGDPNLRARSAVALSILHHMQVLTEAELGNLMDYTSAHPVYNWRKIEVGKLTTTFDL